MADDEENTKRRSAKAVSEFLRRSCRKRPTDRLSFAKFFRGLSYPIVHPVYGEKCRVFPVSTGSASEFYIEPMLSCVGDIDVMYYFSNELAIPAWYPPPTHLPTDFDSRVKVYEIVDSHLPGYVYLNLTYVLSQTSNRKYCGNYTVTEHVSGPNNTLNHELYVTHVTNEDEIHGPAYKLSENLTPFENLSDFASDTVPCIHCLVWPPQAADWPKRYRSCGWPDSATVANVVGQGCDVVGTAHSLCKQDEWMRKHQWRLSFSRAETVLLNSWTPVQQILYHMIRIFVKKSGRLANNAVNSEADAFSNYHIKTSMLWACELQPQSWWNDESTLIRKCALLLQFVDEWLTKMLGQHYFINNVHFLNYLDKLSINRVSAAMRSTTEDSLTQWFIDKYIRSCADLCPGNASFLCSDLHFTSEIPEDTVNTILQWSNHFSSRTTLLEYFSLFKCCLLPLACCFRMTPFECYSLVNNKLYFPMTLLLPTRIDAFSYLSVMASFLLFMTKKVRKLPLTHVLCDVTTYMCILASSSAHERYIIECFDIESEESRNVSPFQKALILMKLAANKHFNTRELVHMQLSQIFLYRALECNDSEHEAVRCLANVYLAVLHYTIGNCQKAFDHLMLMKSQVHSQCKSHAVEGKLLPKIDDNTDSALGLVVLYQYVRTNAMNQKQQTKQSDVFSMEIFAPYFMIKHVLVAKCRILSQATEEYATQAVKFYLHEELKQYMSTISTSACLFTSDLMLCKLSNNSYPLGRTMVVFTAMNSASGHCGRSHLINLMTQLSLQQLTALLARRHLMLPKRTASVTISDITDFMPLYLYRCQQYERCEQLCEQRSCDLTDIDRCNISRVSTTYHEFIQLMDEDVSSLVGLALLLDETRAKSCFRDTVTITQMTLSLYLLVKCRQVTDFVTSATDQMSTLASILDRIAVAQKTIPTDNLVDHFMLKLAERKLVISITDRLKKTDEKAKYTALTLAFNIASENGILAVYMTNGIELCHRLTDGEVRQKLEIVRTRLV